MVGRDPIRGGGVARSGGSGGQVLVLVLVRPTTPPGIAYGQQTTLLPRGKPGIRGSGGDQEGREGQVGGAREGGTGGCGAGHHMIHSGIGSDASLSAGEG